MCVFIRFFSGSLNSVFRKEIIEPAYTVYTPSYRTCRASDFSTSHWTQFSDERSLNPHRMLNFNIQCVLAMIFFVKNYVFDRRPDKARRRRYIGVSNRWISEPSWGPDGWCCHPNKVDGCVKVLIYPLVEAPPAYSTLQVLR